MYDPGMCTNPVGPIPHDTSVCRFLIRALKIPPLVAAIAYIRLSSFMARKTRGIARAPPGLASDVCVRLRGFVSPSNKTLRTRIRSMEDRAITAWYWTSIERVSGRSDQFGCDPLDRRKMIVTTLYSRSAVMTTRMLTGRGYSESTDMMPVRLNSVEEGLSYAGHVAYLWSFRRNRLLGRPILRTLLAPCLMYIGLRGDCVL